MRSFLMLLRREAREMRTVSIVLAVVAPFALLVYEELGAHYTYGETTALWGVPGFVALFAVVIVSDLVSADLTSRRLDALFALPVSPSRLWAAKVGFLVAAVAAMSVWAAVAAGAVYQLRAGAAENAAFANAVMDGLVRCAGAVPVGCTVLFFSTLLPRGIAAALAGVVTLGSLVFGLLQPDWWEYQLSRDVDMIVVGVPTAVALVLLATSWIVFARGPVHVAAWPRKTWLALALPLALFVPASFAAAAALDELSAFEPGDHDSSVRIVSPSPDGRWLAVTLRKPRLRHRVCVIDTRDGSVRALPGVRSFTPPEAWDAEGRLLVWECRIVGDYWMNPEVLRWIDPETLEPTRTRSWGQHYQESGGNVVDPCRYGDPSPLHTATSGAIRYEAQGPHIVAMDADGRVVRTYLVRE